MSKFLSPTHRRQKGFTLIELLVVIAIIGILALIILLALMNARRKGQDTRIKSDVEQTRTQAEVLYDNQGGIYRTSATLPNLTSDASITAFVTDASVQGGALIVNNTDSAFAAQSRMASDPLSFYCVDSAGHAMITPTQLGANTVCSP